MRRIQHAAIARSAIISLGIVLIAFGTPALARAGADYDSLYPTYASVCALSQKRGLEERAAQFWGHSTLFIRGACRDRAAAYPRLKECDVDDSSGVFVSVNALTKNVTWLANDGKDFTLYGNLKSGQPLDRDHYEHEVRKALASGAYEGVKIHEEMRDNQLPVPEFLVRHSIDIDFAINFGRDTVCARLPMPRKALRAVIRYLNSQNDRFARPTTTPAPEYVWSGLHNNCAHLVHNALAALGIWRPKRVNRPSVLQLTDIAVPANEFIDLMELGNSGDKLLQRPGDIFRNAGYRKAFENYGWLPARHGVLTLEIPFHQPNELYQFGLKWFVLDPELGVIVHRFNGYRTTPAYTEVKTNLLHYRDVYRQAITHAGSREARDEVSASASDRRDYDAFLKNYRGYLERELNDVNQKLEALTAG